MIARMDANTKATLATKEEMRADREQRKAKMAERMTAIQAKTGANIRSLLRQLKKYRWNY
jgi:hypothetical protein